MPNINSPSHEIKLDSTIARMTVPYPTPEALAKPTSLFLYARNLNKGSTLKSHDFQETRARRT
jgi:hypothetical protein